MVMDRAYEDNDTRQLVLDLGMVPVVPPKSNRLHLGTMITRFTRSATKSNACSENSKASAASSRALKTRRRISCFP